MSNEDNELLYKDLSARLPYGVIVKYKSREREGTVKLSYGNIEYVANLSTGWWTECKPYLRTLSSMTNEEKEEYELLANHCIVTSVGFVHLEATPLIDWLNKKMFDYRGLIPQKLAIAVTKKNNPYKN